MSVLLGEPKQFGGFVRSPEPSGDGFFGRARAAASFARRESPIQFGSNLLDNEVYEEEIASIERDTGVKIPHPVLGRFPDGEEEIRRRADVLRNQGFRGESVQMARREVQKRLYDEKVAALKARFPDAPSFREENSFAERRKRRISTFERKAAEGGLAAQIAGGIIAAPADPFQVATAPIGFSSKTLLGAFLKNAAANAAVAGAEEPFIQGRRAEIGLEASFEQGLIDVAAAGLFGGGLGAGGKLIERNLAARVGKTLDDPELRAGAHEIERELEIERDVGEAVGGPLDVESRSAALDRIDAAERVIDAAEAGERPARRDIKAIEGEGEAIAARPVREDVAVTPRGRETPVTYAIVDLDDLIASHDQSLQRNPRYPAEFQPRDRSRAASSAQIADIAANLNPNLLDNSTAAGDGAPIIRADGVVLSGNGRVIGLTRAYEGGFAGAERYRAYLKEKGYPVEDAARPVLVRIAETIDDLAHFAREANERATAAMSAAEQARADAANLKPADFNLLEGPDATAAKNARFTRAVVGRISGEAERGALMDKAGALSAEGRRRLRNAIAAYAYDDAALIDRLIEGEDDLKSLGQALIDAAPDFARLKAEIEAGAVDARTDIRAHVGEAAAIVAEARRTGRNVAEFVGQQDMFSGVVDARTVALLRLMFRNEDFTGPRARSKIAEDLQFYVREARKVDAAPGLFGEEGDPTGRLLAGLGARDRGSDAGSPGLFDPRDTDRPPSLLPDADAGGGASATLVARESVLSPFERRMTDFIRDAAKLADPIAVVKRNDPAVAIIELERLREETIEIEKQLAKKFGVQRRNLFQVEDKASPLEAEFLFQSELDVEKIDQLLSLLESPNDEVDLRFKGQAALRDLPHADSIQNPSETEKFAIARLIALNKAALERGEDFLAQIKETVKQRAIRVGNSDPEDTQFVAQGDIEKLKLLFGDEVEIKPAENNPSPQKALPPPPQPGKSVLEFDDPLSAPAQKARAAEIAAALDEIDPDPEGRLITGELAADADGNISAASQSRADLESEFAADDAIVERLKGCVT